MYLQENIRKILREDLDGLDWIRDTKPSITSVEDIKYNLHRPFSLHRSKTGEVDSHTVAIDGIFWIKEHKTSPIRYNICWNTRLGEQCTGYNASDIVENFNEDIAHIWVWKFID